MMINGQIADINSEVSLLEFLQRSNYDISKIAVELNGDIVPKANYISVVLHENDSLEVVSFVGGG